MGKVLSLASAPHGSRTSGVRERLTQMILTGEIGAGERLHELSLAKQLQVSRGPLREALRALESAGLVTAVPNHGVFVRRVELEDALDMYDIRAGYARVAGRLLARRIVKEQFAKLEALYQRMARACTAGNTTSYYAGNLQFHAMLMQFTGNQRLIAVNEAALNELQLYLRNAVEGSAQLRESQAEHRRILDAIKSGNADRAGAAFESHVLAGKQRMLERLGSDRGVKRAGG
jgi:DNA-binding GntR family transcriptional regulator